MNLTLTIWHRFRSLKYIKLKNNIVIGGSLNISAFLIKQSRHLNSAIHLRRNKLPKKTRLISRISSSIKFPLFLRQSNYKIICRICKFSKLYLKYYARQVLNLKNYRSLGSLSRSIDGFFLRFLPSRTQASASWRPRIDFEKTSMGSVATK